MTKQIALFICCLSFYCSLPAQSSSPLHSYHGGVHTPKGDLHVLLIFVRFDNATKMRSAKQWPDISKEGVLPRMAEGASNQFFHQDPEMLGKDSRKKNLSDYYYAMSGGQFRLTGDIFPIQVPITLENEKRGNFFSRQARMNQLAINWIAEHYPDFDWSKYDQRTNSPQYRSDNRETSPDSVLDYVVFMYRDFGSTGMGSSSRLSIPNSVYKIRDGHTGIKSYADAKHNWEYFKHEFAHNLYGCPHYLGANSADGNKFYTQKGWGMMAAWHSPFFTANAWECWWMDWLRPQEPTTNGKYELKDFVTGRDAIRIQIPGTQDYLWLENHQKQDLWDDKIFYNDPQRGYPVSAPGMYAYVVAAPGANRANPRLNPFSREHANMIRMLNAEGQFDYTPTDTMKSEYGAKFPVFQKAAENPISGQNDFQFIRYDFDGDNKIKIGMKHGNKDGGGREEMDVWFEEIDGKGTYSLNCTGDPLDAFEAGDVIGKSGIVPAMNYPVFQRTPQQFEPIVINGIRIKVLKRKKDGTYVLDIRFDDWKLSEDRRWCGNILLPGLEDATQTNTLMIQKGTRLMMNLSGTPNREYAHSATGDCVTPTVLRVQHGQHILLKKGSQMILDEFSELILESGARLTIKKGAEVILRNQGKLHAKTGSELLVEEGGILTVEDTGILLSEIKE
ncbi:MAG: hypothetical protein AAF587_02015 [Bacteroidota bacterium]